MSNEPNENPSYIPRTSYVHLYQPSQQLLENEVKRELQKSFRDVFIEFRIADLRSFNLFVSGLCGNTAIMEVGSLQYLFPRPQLHRKYCFKTLLLQLNRGHHCNNIIGAGKHSNPPLYDLADLTVNVTFPPLHMPNGSKKHWDENSAIWWDESKGVANYTEVHDNTCAIQGNFFLSQGMRGLTFLVMALNPYGAHDFLTSIQRALSAIQFRHHTQLIGLGGMVISNDVIYHNIPSSSTSNISTIEQAQQWLKYNRLTNYTMSFGTILSDIFGQSYIYKYYNCKQHFMYFTRLHFHSVTQNGRGGHIYANKIPLPRVNFGFFSLAEKYYAVDCPWMETVPSISPSITKDFYLPTERLF